MGSVNDKPAQSQWRLCVWGSLSLCIAASIVCWYRQLPFLPEGPTRAVAALTRSLWEDGTLSAAYYTQTFADAQEHSRAHPGVSVWQDVFAVRVDGSLGPKHSPISAVMAVPFFSVLGDAGFLVVHQIVVLLTVLAVLRIVELLTGRSPALAVLGAVWIFAPFLFFVTSYAYDLHGVFFLMSGLCVMGTRPFLGGGVLSLSMFVRPSYLLLILPIAAVWSLLSASESQQVPVAGSASAALVGGATDARSMPQATKIVSRFRYLARAYGGLLSGLGCWAAVNYLLWGGWFTTAYHRLIQFVDGKPVPAPHPVGFDTAVLLSDWGAKVWGLTGLLPYNSCLLAAPWVIRFAFRHPQRRFLLSCLSMAFLNGMYVFSYPMWNSLGGCTRFILPSVCLYLIPFVVWLDSVVRVRSSPATCTNESAHAGVEHRTR